MESDNIQRTIIQFLQEDIPLTSHPYASLAKHLGLTEEEVLQRIKQMLDNGWIRRIGAILRHQLAGFTVNAMVAWKVEENEVDRVGETLSVFQAVSHCYLRDVPENFGYNLFTMVHARNKDELNITLGKMISACGLKDFQVISSIKELKKVSMSYF